MKVICNCAEECENAEICMCGELHEHSDMCNDVCMHMQNVHCNKQITKEQYLKWQEQVCIDIAGNRESFDKVITKINKYLAE